MNAKARLIRRLGKPRTKFPARRALGMKWAVARRPIPAMTRLAVAKSLTPPNELVRDTKKMSISAKNAVPASTVRLSRVPASWSSWLTIESATSKRPVNPADAVAQAAKKCEYWPSIFEPSLRREVVDKPASWDEDRGDGRLLRHSRSDPEQRRCVQLPVRRDSGRIRRYGSRTAGLVDSRRRLASLPGVHLGGFESRAVELVFAVGWAAFWLYWILAAFSMKKGRIAWSRELRI